MTVTGLNKGFHWHAQIRVLCIVEQWGQFSTRWYLCARKSPYALHSVSLRGFPSVAFETVPMFVWLTMALSRPVKENGLAHPLSTPPSSRRSMLWCTWFCARRLRLKFLNTSDISSETKATVMVAFARQSICSVISLDSGMSIAVQPLEFSKVDVPNWHMPVWASSLTRVHFL